MKNTPPRELPLFSSGHPESTTLDAANLAAAPSADEAIHLTILTQYYPPDYAATGQLIEELATNLQSPHLIVRVFTGQPGYAFNKAQAPGIEHDDYLRVKRSQTGRLFPNRIRGKAINGLLFFLRSVVHLCKARNRGDVLLVTTAPPFLTLVGYLVHVLFGTPYICLLYDLYPDIAVELKVISANHWIVKLWDRLNRLIWQNAAQIIVLSSSMKERIVAKYPEGAAKISVIHNWANPAFIMPIPKVRNWFALKHHSNGAPYAILVFSAMLPWQFFANSLSECSNSLIGNANLLSKVYFPRLIIPTSAVIVSFVDFLISGMILLGLMAWYNFVPTWRILTLPLFVAIAFAAAMGAGLWLAALTVKYRDFRYVVPFIVQFGLYISPVGFSSSVVPEQWRLLYSMNPMVGVIDGFRWAILGNSTSIDSLGFTLSIALVILLFVSGILYFRKVERTFADVI
jgi:lipopolysaccharide transport system permease protein